MRRFFQILKSAGVIGIAWAIPWFLAGVGLAVVNGDAPFTWSLFLGTLVGSIGLAGGTVFALGLSAAERDRTLEDLSKIRVGMMGAVGSMAALPIVNIAFNALLGGYLNIGTAELVTMGVIGAGSSLATLGIARAAPALPREVSDESRLLRE